ncbi:MAG: YMGG-like glycine zipper-containing protein [Gemmatimonadaceae bacterium]
MPRVPALSILCLTILAGACTDSRSQEDALAQDTSLTRDLALANQDTALKPELRDVPVTAEQTAAPAVARAQTPRVERRTTAPAAVVKRPAPAPSRSAPAETPEVRVTESGNTERVTERGSEQSLGVVSVGSQISLEAGQKVCTNTNSIGDRFTAQISNPVMGANGTVIPVGATAIVSISSLHRSQRAGDDIEIGLRVESISYGGRTYPVVSETTYAQVDRVRAEARSDDAKKVATGAIIGAVVGQILGKRTKSTVIGAATGAAAGAVVASRNANYDGCVPAGGTITIRLTEPLTIQTTE